MTSCACVFQYKLVILLEIKLVTIDQIVSLEKDFYFFLTRISLWLIKRPVAHAALSYNYQLPVNIK